MLEEAVFSRIPEGELAVDIGGSVTRHARFNRNVHSCNPILGPEDNNRNHRWRDISKPFVKDGSELMHTFVVPSTRVTWCLHKVQECSCAIPDVYTAIHSLYYLTPTEVLALLFKSNKKKVIAVVHTFEDLVGTLFSYGGQSEVSYELLESGMISMQARGNSSSYVHDPMLWLQSLYFEYDGLAMSWNIETVGDSKVVTFVECVTGLCGSTVTPQLSSALADPNYYGDVVVGTEGDSLVQCGFEIALVQQSKFHSCGSFMFVTSGDKRVVIPKGVVDAVAFELLGRDRTADLYQECINRTKKHLSEKKTVIPKAMRVRSAIYVSAMAFTRYVSQEAGVLDDVLRKHNKSFSLFHKLLKFDLTGISCCVGSRTEDPVARFNNGNGASSIRLAGYENPGKAFARVNTTRDMAPIRKGASMNDTFEGKERKASMHQIGVGFTDHLPVVLENTKQHEVLAVANRVVKDTPPEEPNAWKKAINWISSDSEVAQSVLRLGVIEPMAYKDWNATFPPGRQKEHNKAKLEIERDGLSKEDFVRKGFVKIEKYNKGSLDGVEDMDPRLIQGVSHKANVALGPAIASFGKRLKAEWNPDNDVCYSGGLTAEEIGLWMKKSIESFGGMEECIFLECDFSKFDCSQGKGAYLFEKYVYQKIGKLNKHPDAYRTFQAQAMTRGRCAQGTTYRVRYGRKSGDPNTSCGNSLLNGVTCAISLENLGLRFKVIVMGDDMLAVLSRKQVTDPAAMVSKYETMMKSYGFVPKAKINTVLAKVEFCSGLFWPVGTEDYVLGPKPGRLAPKMGFSHKKLSAVDVVGTYVGYAQNCGHVPILRQLAKVSSQKREKAMLNKYSANSSRAHVVCDRTALFFEERYGVSYDLVETRIRKALEHAAGNLLPSSLLEEVYTVDN
jgi:hypothetical protein